MPTTCMSGFESMTEYTGRRARVGHSAVVMAVTLTGRDNTPVAQARSTM